MAALMAARSVSQKVDCWARRLAVRKACCWAALKGTQWAETKGRSSVGLTGDCSAVWWAGRSAGLKVAHLGASSAGMMDAHSAESSGFLWVAKTDACSVARLVQRKAETSDEQKAANLAAWLVHSWAGSKDERWAAQRERQWAARTVSYSVEPLAGSRAFQRAAHLVHLRAAMKDYGRVALTVWHLAATMATQMAGRRALQLVVSTDDWTAEHSGIYSAAQTVERTAHCWVELMGEH